MENRKNFWKGALFGALAMLVVSLIVAGILMVFSMMGYGRAINAKTERKLAIIQMLIEKNYLYYDELDEETLQDALIKGYVEGLGEVYSVYYDEKETTALKESTSGEFSGIGVGVMQDLTTGLVTFTTIYEDSPGEAAGFQPGDIVYKVNGEDVSSLDLDTIVSKIRGEVGTKVEITVIRGDDKKEYTATATRALIQNDTVDHEMKEDKIGYIHVSGFKDNTYKEFKEALTELTEQNMQGLVIDLRGNPGGNLSTVCEMLDLILPKGTIVSVKYANKNTKVYTSDDQNQLNVPLVLLINGHSASASEIFAGAVQDYGIGTLVGTTTYGKGVVQNIYSLGDGTSLKLTSAEYFTPNGRNIHGIGVKPDVEIEYVSDSNNPDADNQLEKALEILKSKM